MATHQAPFLLGVAPEEAQIHCIFIHGRTQSPEDMQQQVIGRLNVSDVAFVLPRAAGNSWYGARATERLTPSTREELDRSLDYVRSIAEDLSRRRHATPLVIGGFSQGACLALEYAMKYGPWRGAMANLTGCRVGTAECDRPFADLDRMPVYLTGSDKDPWIPVEAFSSAVENLARARACLRCEVLPDRAHEVSSHEITSLESLLATTESD